MEFFNPIDRTNWEREEYFTHFFSDVPCTYSMTVRLDITQLKRSQQKIYPALLHRMAKVVNNHPEFRTAYNRQGQLGVFSQMMPCYTIFHKDTHTFSSIWTPYAEDYNLFLKDYQDDMDRFGHVHKREAKPNAPENCFNVSMIPWEDFEGFHLNLQKGYQYLLPIFTLGKYQEKDGRYTMPLAIQVHHAVCDGFHVCCFVEELKSLLG